MSVGSSDLIGDHKPVVDSPFLGGGGHNTGLNIHAELIEVSELYLLLANEFDTLIYVRIIQHLYNNQSMYIW